MRTAGPLPTVLMLDDEPSVRASVRRFLQAYGYRCIEADTVDRAFQALRGTRVDALIVDVRLPGPRSGLDFLADVRLQPDLANVPALVMTGGVLSEAEEVWITKQRGHLFYKPEGFDTIVDFLDQLTGRDHSH